MINIQSITERNIQESNANLTESAPELLKSVEFAMEFLDSLPKGWLGKVSGADIGALNDFYLTAKPALKKSRGE